MSNAVQVTGIGSSTKSAVEAIDEALDSMRDRLAAAINNEEKKYSCNKKTCLPAFEWTPKLDIQPDTDNSTAVTIHSVVINGTYTGKVRCKPINE
jgi:hypothetical protein